jgi:signal transduction histidine kinase
MRWQLFAAFAFLIALMMGSSWWLALRTTTNEFALLVSGDNQQQARLVAPTLLQAYNQSGDWAQVQANLEQQLAQQDRFNVEFAPFWAAEPLQQGVISIRVDGPSEMGTGRGPFGGNRPCQGTNCAPMVGHRWDFNIAIPSNWGEWDFGDWLEFEGNAPVLVEPSPVGSAPQEGFLIYNGGMRPIHGQPQAVFTEAPSITWTVGNVLLADQRALVMDARGQVVVDTANQLLGKSVNAQDLQAGVPLYTDAGRIGTLVITPRNGVYTMQQSAFLQEVRQGFLVTAAISTAIALLLAFTISERITRPLRSLTEGTERLQGGEWGYQVAFKARNEIGRLGQAFNQMSRHLAEQRALRVRLVDDLAHELNTPLSLMQLELQAMADGLQTPNDAATQLNQELSEVGELVADLIFLANRDAAPPPTMQPLDLNELVAATVKRFEGSASQQKGQQLIFLPQANVESILGDPYLVGRAVSNLISNALRHTPHSGRITVFTRQQGTQVEVGVQDTGEGIPAEHLPHIFERFYRTDQSRARHSGGRGLGLAIVQQIMTQHQGRVLVESQEGQGSTFRLVWGRV